ncbi:hypothetical protein [Sodalis-like endosymbiont of Proechinophthirus fluctus]|nr:hypothetical protein [Sodalis-like endosymbiont of Proechinophthirus fluctus]
MLKNIGNPFFVIEFRDAPLNVRISDMMAMRCVLVTLLMLAGKHH